MRAILNISLLIALVTVTILSYKHIHSNPTMQSQTLPLGLREFIYEDASRTFDGKPRKLEVAVWYPTNQINPQSQPLDTTFWKLLNVVRNAPVTDDKLPLILFSHGYGGSQWSNSWFAEQLALHGYIVASVRHYGNSAGNMIPELSVRAWNRPADISFVLDHLLQDPDLSVHIDQDKIGAAGFSQGGLTALWLAGIQANLTPQILHRQITALSDPEWRNEHFADLPAERLDTILDTFSTADFEHANTYYRDQRIKAAFAMAPALDAENVMFEDEGLKKSTIPVHIIVGQADTECVPQALFFARHIPHCILTIIPGQVGHLTMLNEGITPNNTVYTTDHPTIKRASVHTTIAQEANQFFDRHLKGIQVKTTSNYIDRNNITNSTTT